MLYSIYLHTAANKLTLVWMIEDWRNQLNALNVFVQQTGVLSWTECVFGPKWQSTFAPEAMELQYITGNCCFKSLTRFRNVIPLKWRSEYGPYKPMSFLLSVCSQRCRHLHLLAIMSNNVFWYFSIRLQAPPQHWESSDQGDRRCSPEHRCRQSLKVLLDLSAAFDTVGHVIPVF